MSNSLYFRALSFGIRGLFLHVAQRPSQFGNMLIRIRLRNWPDVVYWNVEWIVQYAISRGDIIEGSIC